MPLETRDKDPKWAEGYRTSPEEAQRIRQTWLEAGRQVWNDATRTGRNVAARTESDLVALGKELIAKQAAEQRASTDGREAPLIVAEHMLGSGTPENPKPGDLVREWRTGEGPAKRVFPEDSEFSQRFVQAPSVARDVRRAAEGWQARPVDKGGSGGEYTNFVRFSAPEAIEDWGNGPASVIGSARLTGERQGDQLAWTATNEMGRKSFFAGHLLRDLHLPFVPDRRRPGPYGTTEQAIHFRTDLAGNPVRRRH